MRRPFVPEESFGGNDIERGSRELPAKQSNRDESVAVHGPAVERMRHVQRACGNRALQRMVKVLREQPRVEPADEELAPESGGQPLDLGSQRALEAHFGADLAGVRVHSDSLAARGAEAIDAQAYTAGRDIYFAPGMYAPSTGSGQRLLAHEVAHVVQQSSGKEPGIAAESRGGMRIGAGAAQRSIQHQPARSIQRQAKAAGQIASEELDRGPHHQKGDKAAWEQAVRHAQEEAKKGDALSIIQVSLSKNHDAVREVSSAEFEKEFKKCPNAQQENLLPEAFLCTQSGVSPWTTLMDDDAKVDTNIHVQTKPGGRGGGEVWVRSAILVWSLKTAGFLDIARIDPSMLGPYRDHERGHREIEDQIATRLAKLAEADLRRLLPQEKTPLKESGKDWVQVGIDVIDKRVREVKDRYLRWADELASKANAAWDSQEARTLSRIARARKGKHEPTAPSTP